MKPTINGITETYIKPPLPMGKALCAELRKPETRQAKGQLKSDEGECCLGVLCRLQGRLKLHNGRWMDGKDMYYLSRSNPLKLHLYHNGRFPHGINVAGRYASLAELNDANYTFPVIADIIETIWDCQ